MRYNYLIEGPVVYHKISRSHLSSSLGELGLKKGCEKVG